MGVGELKGYLLERHRAPWKPLSRLQAALGLGGALLLLLVYLARDDGWLPLVDSLNLVFHESGHPIFGIFGETIGFLGGTLMQLLVPLLVVGAAWMRREALGIALASLWFFQNGLNISRYIADARAQELPLVGGGEHDWATLLGQWGLLHRDLAIARAVQGMAWSGILVCCLWFLWRALNARTRSES